MANPVCPVTGERAVRLVQWVEAATLVDLWRAVCKVDVRSSFGALPRFGLWESPTGLYFFEPALEGSPDFYRRLYGYLIERGVWSRDAVRSEFDVAAARIRPGDRVLDVGCGDAAFRAMIPNANYVGLDPSSTAAIEGVSDQALSAHLHEHAESYDAVCAFQVLEHVADPRQMFLDMVRAAKPGGLLIVSVPHVPSAMTRIPNFLINAPPHHLTWWTKPALAALAERSGATVEVIENTAWNEHDSLVYWTARCSPIRCRDTHFRGIWRWHISTLIGFLLGRLMHAVRPRPTGADEGSSLVMIARRAG